MKCLEPAWLRFYNTLGLDNERVEWNFAVGWAGAAMHGQGDVFGFWL